MNPNESISASFSFRRTCDHLGRSPDEVVALREEGLVAYRSEHGKQIYPIAALNVTRRLLAFEQMYHWKHPTLALYADLVFATEIGRAILLPMSAERIDSQSAPTNWLETPYVSAVLPDLDEMLEDTEGPLVTLLRSLTAATVGPELFWADVSSLKESSLYPLIAHFENKGVPILNQGSAILRDAGPIFQSLLHTFVTIAPPISRELGLLVAKTQARMEPRSLLPPSISADEQAIIVKEGLIAVDKLYASRANEIHTLPEAWDFKLSVISADGQTVTIQMRVPATADDNFIDNIIDLIRPFFGNYGARVVGLLYEIANDAPYWRNPQVVVDTNELLDRLGLKRDSRGIHRSGNRERLRDVLNAAHNLEVIGEYTTWENGEQVRKAFRRTVLSLIGATYDVTESQDLSSRDLFQRGLPKSMTIKLNFYDGVRRPDGRLGNQYVLMRRLAEPKALPKANYSATHELLRAYFFVRYRQTQMKTRSLSVTRQTALEKAQITTKNITRAAQILTRALEKLVEEGTLERFSEVPLKGHDSFEVVLSAQSAQD